MECGECDNKPWWAQENQKNKTMIAEEYIKHYASGQGGFESVSVDIALRAIEYAKQEIKQQLMKDAVMARYMKRFKERKEK